MNLEIFDKTTAPTAVSRGYRAISVNRRNARLTLSAILVEEMGIKPDMSIYIARNKDAKCEWYIRFDNSDKGLKIRPHKGGGGSKGYVSLGITTRSLTVMMLESLKAQRGASLLVAAKPTNIDGQEWYQLITSKPLRIN